MNQTRASFPFRLRSRRPAFLLLALAAAGCAGTLAPPTPATHLAVPGNWRESSHGPANLPSGGEELAVWWQLLEDPTLDRIIERVLAGNLDLATARARVAEARARRGVARSALYPRIGNSVSATRRDARSEETSESYSTSFEVSWEADLFGAHRLAAAASEADLAATLEELRATRVLLLAEAVGAYVDLRVGESRLGILDTSLASREETWQLTLWRERAGLVSALEVAQARTSLEQARSARPEIEQRLTENRLRLELLAGQAPGSLDDLLSSTRPAIPPIPVPPTAVAAGIPADSLRQRPDVRGAEQAVTAALARRGEAEAARYPSLRLAGSLDAQALSAGDLFDADALVANLLAGLTGPIFEGGRIRQNIAIQDALVEQAAIAYRNTVLTALSEVEAALAGCRRARERIATLEVAVETAQELAELADLRYAAGLVDLLVVLDAQRSLLDLEEQLASARGTSTTNFATLYRTLGGGWTESATGEPDA